MPYGYANDLVSEVGFPDLPWEGASVKSGHEARQGFAPLYSHGASVRVRLHANPHVVQAAIGIPEEDWRVLQVTPHGRRLRLRGSVSLCGRAPGTRHNPQSPAAKLRRRLSLGLYELDLDTTVLDSVFLSIRTVRVGDIQTLLDHWGLTGTIEYYTRLERYMVLTPTDAKRLGEALGHTPAWGRGRERAKHFLVSPTPIPVQFGRRERTAYLKAYRVGPGATSPYRVEVWVGGQKQHGNVYHEADAKVLDDVLLDIADRYGLHPIPKPARWEPSLPTSAQMAPRDTVLRQVRGSGWRGKRPHAPPPASSAVLVEEYHVSEDLEALTRLRYSIGEEREVQGEEREVQGEVQGEERERREEEREVQREVQGEERENRKRVGRTTSSFGQGDAIEVREYDHVGVVDEDVLSREAQTLSLPSLGGTPSGNDLPFYALVRAGKWDDLLDLDGPGILSRARGRESILATHTPIPAPRANQALREAREGAWVVRGSGPGWTEYVRSRGGSEERPKRIVGPYTRAVREVGVIPGVYEFVLGWDQDPAGLLGSFVEEYGEEVGIGFLGEGWGSCAGLAGRYGLEREGIRKVILVVDHTALGLGWARLGSSELGPMVGGYVEECVGVTEREGSWVILVSRDARPEVAHGPMKRSHQWHDTRVRSSLGDWGRYYAVSRYYVESDVDGEVQSVVLWKDGLEGLVGRYCWGGFSRSRTRDTRGRTKR